MKRLFIILSILLVFFAVLHVYAAEGEEDEEFFEDDFFEEDLPTQGMKLPDIAPKDDEADATQDNEINAAEEITDEDYQDELSALDPEELEKMPINSKLEVDSVVIVSYTFESSPDSYQVKYHLNLGGNIKTKAGRIKGMAKVATDISGYLAKSTAFECMLKVTVATAPYEVIYNLSGEDELNLDVSIKGQLLEDWESFCTFLDQTKAKFNTRGNPELWINNALSKSDPPMSKLVAEFDKTKTTTVKFTVPKYTVRDEGLGFAEVEGTGVITIKPSMSVPKKEPE